MVVCDILAVVVMAMVMVVVGGGLSGIVDDGRCSVPRRRGLRKPSFSSSHLPTVFYSPFYLVRVSPCALLASEFIKRLD